MAAQREPQGTDEQGEPIEVVGRLMPAARRQREDPLAFIADQDVFGDLADDQRFVAAYTSALASLHLRGPGRRWNRWPDRGAHCHCPCVSPLCACGLACAGGAELLRDR